MSSLNTKATKQFFDDNLKNLSQKKFGVLDNIKHKGRLADLSENEWLEFARIVKALEKATEKAFKAMPFNWACMMNNTYQEVNANPHVHWHFRPRYKTSITVNNTDFSDPRYGHHYDRDKRRHVDAEITQVILEKLKDSLWPLLFLSSHSEFSNPTPYPI